MSNLLKSFATSYHGTIDKWAHSICEGINLNATEIRYVADFGKGFYMTNEFQRALTWARSKRDFVVFRGQFKAEEVRPTVVKVEVDIEALMRLQGIAFEELDQKWADFIYQCRKEGFNHKLYHSFDYVCGWIADKNVAKLANRIRRSSVPSTEFMASILPSLFFGQQYQLSLNTSKAVWCIMKMEVIYV